MSRTNLTTRDFVSLKNIAEYCMVSPSTIRRWIKDGELTAIRLPGGHFRVIITDLIDFLKRNNLPISIELQGAINRENNMPN